MESKSPAPVKIVKQDNMGKAIEILQPGVVGIKHFDCTAHTSGAGRLYGHSFGLGERRVDDPDRI